MKQFSMILSMALIAIGISGPVMAQEKKKEDKEKKSAETIVITRKVSDENKKVVIEIEGDKVTVNGKPASESDEVKVHRNKIRSYGSMDFAMPFGEFEHMGEHPGFFFDMGEDRAFLGVVTEEGKGGVEIKEVTRESAAEKAGLKAGDIISKVNDDKVEDPDDLTEAIRKRKPGDKVTIHYSRDNKEQKVTAELGKWKFQGMINSWQNGPLQEMQNLREHMQVVPRPPRAQTFTLAGGSPRLGISVQDTEDGKGVKILEVEDESNAKKGGLEEGDIITHMNEKEVNNATEVASRYREFRDKGSIQFRVNRKGKVQNIEVKIPRRLRTADL